MLLNKMTPSIKQTEKVNEYNVTIWIVRKAVIADEVMGKMAVEEG